MYQAVVDGGLSEEDLQMSPEQVFEIGRRNALILSRTAVNKVLGSQGEEVASYAAQLKDFYRMYGFSANELGVTDAQLVLAVVR